MVGEGEQKTRAMDLHLAEMVAVADLLMPRLTPCPVRHYCAMSRGVEPLEEVRTEVRVEVDTLLSFDLQLPS